VGKNVSHGECHPIDRRTTYVALVRVLHVRVDTSLENILELLGFRMLAVEQTSEVDVKESGTVESRFNFHVRKKASPETPLTYDPDKTGLSRCHSH